MDGSSMDLLQYLAEADRSKPKSCDRKHNFHRFHALDFHVNSTVIKYSYSVTYVLNNRI